MSGAGLNVRQSPPSDAPPPIDAGGSLVQLHQRLLTEDVVEAIVANLRECPGERRGDYRRTLQEVGVTALDGRLAAALSTLATGTDPDADHARAYALQAVLDLLGRLGTGHVNGDPSDRDDVFTSLPPLLTLASTSTRNDTSGVPPTSSTPTVSVRLGIEFASADASDREAVLRYLADLSAGARVFLVISDAAAHRIVEAHADVVPTWLLTKCADRRGPRGAPVAEREARQTAADASKTLNPDARPVAVLRHLARSSTHSLPYGRLASRMALESPPHESARRLDEDHGLVERTERADGVRVVSLRPAGWDYLSSLSSGDGSEGGLSAVSSVAGGEASGSETGVSQTPENLTAMPCYPSAWDPPHPGPAGAADETGDRPPEEAAEAATGDRTDRYITGLVEPRYGGREDWMPAVEAVETGEMALVDVDFSERMADDRDGRAPLVSYDAANDAVHVAGEYSNPMQYATAVAHGLTCEKLLATADWTDRIGEGLEGLEIPEKPVLWSATCMGWLPADVEDGEDWLAELRAARDALLQMSGLANNPDSEVTRSMVTRFALGLVGTIVQLYDLLGAEVVLEMRIGKESSVGGHYSRRGNPGQRADLVKHLGTLAALTSRTGAFSVFRQLFEDREYHRSDAFTLGCEPGKHPSEGSMRAGFVVSGAGVESLAKDLRYQLRSPRQVHADAPSISVPIDVRTGVDRDRFRATVRRLLEARGLRPTSAAVMALRAFGISPWAAAEGLLLGLEAEDDAREVDLFEVRRALGVLDPGRLLPDVKPSARAGVGTLLDAERPISQAELGRRTDGCSEKSWSNHKSGLVAADIVRETDEGWRLALPFQGERFDVPDVANPPWYLLADADDAPAGSGDPRTRKVTDVLWWLVERGVLEADRLLDPEDPVGYAVETVGEGLAALPRGAQDRAAAAAALDAAGVPPGIVLAGVQCPGGPPPTARMGSATRQATLS